MRRAVRVLCYDQGGCLEGEYNRWPRDSIVWFRPKKVPYLFKGSIIRTEKNFLICTLEDRYNMDMLSKEYAGEVYGGSRVKIHKREIYDVLTAPHFHYGFVGHRENFIMPQYPHYRGVFFYETPAYSPCKEENK